MAQQGNAILPAKAFCRSVFFLLCFCTVFVFPEKADAGTAKFRIGIIGLTHGHAYVSFKALDTAAFEIAGIAETNERLINLYTAEFHLPKNLFYTSATELLQKAKPQAVAVFSKTNEHAAIVAECAPFGITMMMEKPMANTVSDAAKIAALEQQFHLHIVVNFETTWHPSIQKAYAMAFEEDSIGKVFKMVFHMGTSGPVAGNANKEFVAWLTDPKENAGGAITDFGCYGINLATWFLQGEKPVSVLAITKNLKPEKYPGVDDEADIILNYKDRVAIVQASWDWPFARKDLELYGTGGTAQTLNSAEWQYRLVKKDWQKEKLTDTGFPVNEAFHYLENVALGNTKPATWEPGTVTNNILVTEVLIAARKSAATGQAVVLQ